MSYEQILNENRRLVILRFLNEIVGNSANESVLETAANKIGVTSTREDIRDELSFLQERGCIKIEWYADKCMVAKLTRRGQYVAEGKENIYGIKSPSLD